MSSILGGSGDVASRIFYVPPWVRLLAMFIILALLASSGLVLIRSIDEPGLHNWTIAALATAELAGAAALAMLFLFFVERGHRTTRLDSLCRTFFTAEIPAALRKVSHKCPPLARWEPARRRYDPLESLVEVDIAYADGSYVVDYLVRARGATVCMSVEANVKRISVVYSVEIAEGETPKQLFAHFKDTFDGARSAGYHLGVPRRFIGAATELPPNLGWRDAASISLHLNKEDGFLHNEVERHYVAQDISIMTRSFLDEGIGCRLFPRRAGGEPAPAVRDH